MVVIFDTESKGELNYLFLRMMSEDPLFYEPVDMGMGSAGSFGEVGTILNVVVVIGMERYGGNQGWGWGEVVPVPHSSIQNSIIFPGEQAFRDFGFWLLLLNVTLACNKDQL